MSTACNRSMESLLPIDVWEADGDCLGDIDRSAGNAALPVFKSTLQGDVAYGTARIERPTCPPTGTSMIERGL